MVVGGSGTGVSPHNRAATHTRLAWSVYTHRPLEPSPLLAAGEDTPAGDDGDGDAGCGGDAAAVMRINGSMEPTNHCRRHAETIP